MVDTAIATVNGRLPIVVGVSDVTTAKTIRRARHAQRAGADAVMVLPVSYWKLTEREIVQHYRSIGEAIGISIMAYNNPATSGVDMRPELLVSMFDTIDNVTMVKESTGVTCPGCSASPNFPAASCPSTTAPTRWCSTR